MGGKIRVAACTHSDACFTAHPAVVTTHDCASAWHAGGTLANAPPSPVDCSITPHHDPAHHCSSQSCPPLLITILPTTGHHDPAHHRRPGELRARLCRQMLERLEGDAGDPSKWAHIQWEQHCLQLWVGLQQFRAAGQSALTATREQQAALTADLFQLQPTLTALREMVSQRIGSTAARRQQLGQQDEHNLAIDQQAIAIRRQTAVTARLPGEAEEQKLAQMWDQLGVQLKALRAELPQLAEAPAAALHQQPPDSGFAPPPPNQGLNGNSPLALFNRLQAQRAAWPAGMPGAFRLAPAPGAGYGGRPEQQLQEFRPHDEVGEGECTTPSGLGCMGRRMAMVCLLHPVVATCLPACQACSKAAAEPAALPLPCRTRGASASTTQRRRCRQSCLC